MQITQGYYMKGNLDKPIIHLCLVLGRAFRSEGLFVRWLLVRKDISPKAQQMLAICME